MHIQNIIILVSYKKDYYVQEIDISDYFYSYHRYGK